MSHITLLQYITQLQNLGLTQPQINEAAQEWKKIHTPKKFEEKPNEQVEVIEQVNVTEEGKTPVVTEDDAIVATETKPASDPSSSSDSKLSFLGYEFPGITDSLKNLERLDIKDLITPKQTGFQSYFEVKDKGFEIPSITQLEKEFKASRKRNFSDPIEGEVIISEDGVEYKYEVNDKGFIDFYYKPKDQDDFINQTAKMKDNPEQNYLNFIKTQNKLGFLKDDKYNDLVKEEKERLEKNKGIEAKNAIAAKNKALYDKYVNFTTSIDNVYKRFEDAYNPELGAVEDLSFGGGNIVGMVETEVVNKALFDPLYYKRDMKFPTSEEDTGFVNLMFGNDIKSIVGEENYDDFIGYLYQQDLMNDLKSRFRNGELGVYGMNEEDAQRASSRILKDFNFDLKSNSVLPGGMDLTGLSDSQKLNKLEVGRQRIMSKILENFLTDKQTRSNEKLLLGYIMANPDQFKEFENSSAGKEKAIEKASKLIKNQEWNENRSDIIPIADFKGIQDYTNGFFSKLKAQNDQLISKKNQEIARLQEKGDWDGALAVGLDASADSITTRVGDFIDGGLNFFTNVEALFSGGDTSFTEADRQRAIQNAVRNEQVAQTLGDVRYMGIYGKKIVDKEGLYGVKGNEYILSDGAIYNTTTKTPLGQRDKKTYLALKKALENSEESGLSVSGSGSLIGTMSTVTGLAFDLLGTKGIGGATTKLGRATGLRNITRIPKARLDGALYWSSLGYVQTKSTTYSELLANGVSKEKARDISETAGLQGAAVYGVFSLFSPTEKYLGAFGKNSQIKNAIKKSVEQYKKSGGNFNTFFKDALKRLKPGQKAIGVVEENIEEGLQLAGETLGINSYINREVGRDVMDTEITVSDAVNNVILSSAASYSASSAKMPKFASNGRKKIESLYALGQNQELANKFLSELVKQGEITTQQSSEIMQQAKAVINQSHNIPSFVGAEASLESAIILQEIADLKNRLKNTDPAFRETIELRIQERQEALSEVVKPELEKSKQREAARKNAELLEASFETFTTQEDVDSRKKELMGEGGRVVKSVGYGEAITTEDGKTFILINDQVAGEDNKYTTDQHEVLHPFWEQALKGNPELAISFGKALMNEFLTNTEISGGAQFIAKFNQYINDTDYSAEKTWSEVIPLMSEYLSSGDIQYNPEQEAWYKRIGNYIMDFLKDPSNKQRLNITFDTGKDVFDFLVAYNKNTDAGKSFTEAQLKVATEGATGTLVEEGFTGDIDTKAGVAIESTDVELKKQDAARNETEIKESVAKESKRVEDSQEVQRLYDEQGVSAAMDIIEKFKPITSKIVEARSQAPNFDRQLLTDEIETGKRGILDLVMEYKPESGVPLAAYINKFLPARAIEASQRVLGEEFTTDVTEAKGVVAEEITEVVEEKPTRLTKPSSLLPAEAVTEITEQVKEKIKGIDPKSMTFKKLGDLAPEVIAREIGIPVKKLTDPRANLSKGDATAIQQFVNKNADKLLRILPEGSVTEAATDDILGTSTGVPTGLLKAFYTKGKRSTRGAGLTPFIKNKNISKADFLEAFGIVEGKKAEGFSARSPQAQALKGIASLYGRLVTNEVSRSPEVGLKPEAKQRVAAGKSKSMASKRFESQAEFKADEEIYNLFVKATESKSKTQLAKILDFDLPPINEKTRPGLKTKMLEAVKKYKLDTATIEAGLMASGGKQTFYGIQGGKMYPSAPAASEAGIKNPIKFGKTTDGKFLPINTPGVTNWIAKPGRMYYASGRGKAKVGVDPDYQELLDAAKVYDGPKPARIIPEKARSKNKKIQEEVAQQEKDNMEVLDHVVTQLTKAVADGMSLDIAAAIIIQSYQATGGLIKITAPFKYTNTKESIKYATRKGAKQDQKKGRKFREEHNPPASTVGASIIAAIKFNASKPVMDAVKNNYYQTVLSKFNDDLLEKSNLDSTLVEGQTIFDNPISRLAAAGINLQEIKNVLTGKTIAEDSGFGIDQDFYNGLNKDQQEQASAIQNDLIIKGLSDPDLDVKAMIDNLVPLAPGKAMASKRDAEMEPSSLGFNKFKPVEKVIENLGKADQALNKGRRVNPPVKKIRVFDFDDTLARSNSKVIVINPDANIDVDMLDIIARRKFKKEFENLPSYKQSYDSLSEQQKLEVLKEMPGATTEINATQFAEQAADLEAQGATFDFSQFEQVIDGKKGPLFDVAKKIADKRGTEDLFVLTARPQSADGPIKEFMKALGIDIPLSNITGLGDGTAQAKARWIVDKAADGYNDFYFADDATKNVKAVKDVLSQLDVKSKVQQARASKRDTFNTVVNDMIEDSSGIESYKTFSAAKARTVGRDKGRFDWITLASSAEDFKGLLYRLLGNGKKGEAQYEFLKTNLIDPYNRAEDSIIQAKISAANDFMALKEQFTGLPKTLETETGVGKFTYQHALRTYIWTQQGMSIPGLSKTDVKRLNKFITDDAKLQAFADQLMSIQKGKPYPKPGKEWLGGNLTTDIIGGINKVNRKEYQQEWQENVDIIFSPENLNKMEAAYGTRWRKALENTLKRMKAGTNRLGYTDSSNAVLDWVNNSVGAVMFLNTRSALLQTISAVNFLNWGDNNIIKAGAAFANQKQYWADFMKLINSDYLVQRRNGLKINVSESEIADAVKDSQNKPKAAIAFLLSKGFVFTRYADSFAIATGGSTFYRNRIKKYLKEGMDQKLAEQKAFEDFKDVAEESQQSSDPSKISMQQASGAGRVILNWANTPMQYVRIQKRDLQDLIAGRGDPKVKIARIAYYGVVQNLIFNALQQALFAIGFGDDDDDEEKSAAKKKQDNKKIARVANGMIDSQLKGLGIAGMGMLSVKNTLMKIYEESGKKRPEYEAASIEALSFSPAISSKYRKFVGGLKSFSWNMKEIKEKGFSLDNPAYLAGAQIITAFTNIPIDRVMKKANNIRGIVSEQSQMWQKVAMGVGYSSYDVGLPYYGGWDKPVEPTEAERKKQEIDIMKRDTNTAEQTQILLDLGLDKKQIKALRYEDARVKKIIELQNKNKEK